MPNIAGAVVQIQAAGLPVLFADIGSLLDVIRAPLRPGELPGCVEAASELLHLVSTPPVQCTLVVASLVPSEWLTHAGLEADSLRTHLAKIDEEASRLHKFCGLAGITPPFPKPEYRLLFLAERLFDLSPRLLDGAFAPGPGNDMHHPGPRAGVQLHPAVAEGRRGEGLDDHRRVPRGKPAAASGRVPLKASVLHLEQERLLRGRVAPPSSPGGRFRGIRTRVRDQLALGRQRAQEALIPPGIRPILTPPLADRNPALPRVRMQRATWRTKDRITNEIGKAGAELVVKFRECSFDREANS